MPIKIYVKRNGKVTVIERHADGSHYIDGRKLSRSEYKRITK